MEVSDMWDGMHGSIMPVLLLGMRRPLRLAKPNPVVCVHAAAQTTSRQVRCTMQAGVLRCTRHNNTTTTQHIRLPALPSTAHHSRSAHSSQPQPAYQCQHDTHRPSVQEPIKGGRSPPAIIWVSHPPASHPSTHPTCPRSTRPPDESHIAPSSGNKPKNPRI